MEARLAMKRSSDHQQQGFSDSRGLKERFDDEFCDQKSDCEFVSSDGITFLVMKFHLLGDEVLPSRGKVFCSWIRLDARLADCYTYSPDKEGLRAFSKDQWPRGGHTKDAWECWRKESL